MTYARVSTADQVDTGTSLDDQKRRLTAAAAARPALHVAHFEDAGVSGSLESRPGLDALIARVAEGDIALVLATKIDRVSRSAIGLLKLVETLRRHRCDLVLIDEGLDTSTPAGDLTSGVLGVIGGWERRRIAERTNQGRLTAAQTEGRFGPYPLWWTQGKSSEIPEARGTALWDRPDDASLTSTRRTR